MNKELKCQNCGHVGLDVAPRIVAVKPTREIRVYATAIPVPERFRVEARCIEHEECADRAEDAIRRSIAEAAEFGIQVIE